ncbi:MAG: N-acetyltransferase [Candidatus Scalindua sp.]|jgi:UDP-2-acetamido-3-amino-2,3-dideoxy-glucuronate N-acetyltransferase|nr:N-acetyltransferase [Candidatus Scalindua sp.]MBT6046010.1 N-acetyltransferase [Candidatus Scalindua sp.]
MNEYLCISDDVKLGKGVKFSKFINLYGCIIGDNCKIGAFVEVQKNSIIGKNCKISSHTFICEGVNIGDNCFVGHGVMFINDNYPESAKDDGCLQSEEDWASRFVETHIGNNVSIGSNVTILGNVTIGAGSIIGAGSVVTRNIPSDQIWAGNPAKMLRANKGK